MGGAPGSRGGLALLVEEERGRPSAGGTGGVAIVGAGAAGLAAAWTFLDGGLEPTLFEAAERPGGRLRTEPFAGVPVEVGAQFLASHQTQTRRLAEAVGAGDLLIAAPGKDALWRGGRAHSIQYGSVASMLTSGALPAGLKLRMASRYVPFLHRHGRALDPNDVRPAAERGLDGPSIAEWGQEHLGEDFVELLARPQTAAYYGSEPERTSAALYHSLASAALDLRLLGVRGGMGALAARWADALTARGAAVRYDAQVTSVASDPAGVAVTVADGDPALFRAVVVATPPAVAATLFGGAPVAEALRDVESAASSLLAVRLDRPWRAGWFGLGVPRTEAEGETLAVVGSAAGRRADPADADAEVALIFPAPDALDPATRADPKAAFGALWPPARRLLGGEKGPAATQARLYREPYGYSLFPPGFSTRLDRVRAAGRPQGTWLAGDYLVSPSVEGAVRSGLEAARAAVDWLSGSRPAGG